MENGINNWNTHIIKCCIKDILKGPIKILLSLLCPSFRHLVPYLSESDAAIHHFTCMHQCTRPLNDILFCMIQSNIQEFPVQILSNRFLTQHLIEPEASMHGKIMIHWPDEVFRLNEDSMYTTHMDRDRTFSETIGLHQFYPYSIWQTSCVSHTWHWFTWISPSNYMHLRDVCCTPKSVLNWCSNTSNTNE